MGDELLVAQLGPLRRVLHSEPDDLPPPLSPESRLRELLLDPLQSRVTQLPVLPHEGLELGRRQSAVLLLRDTPHQSSRVSRLSERLGLTSPSGPTSPSSRPTRPRRVPPAPPSTPLAGRPPSRRIRRTRASPVLSHPRVYLTGRRLTSPSLLTEHRHLAVPSVREGGRRPPTTAERGRDGGPPGPSRR